MTKQHNCSGYPASLEPGRVFFSVCDKDRWRPSICFCPRPIDVMEMQTPLDEQQRVSPLPDVLHKHCRFGPCKDQSDTVSVVCQPRQPHTSFPSVRRVKPNPAAPRFRQSIIENAVVVGRRIPGPANSRAARIKIKRAERINDFGRRQPLVFEHFCALVISHAHHTTPSAAN